MQYISVTIPSNYNPMHSTINYV